ncbi:NAD(P)/FAD-dependent oxidoreductase [Chitinophaga eiseniae]|uniref:Dehydrogenase (Flavoprotein) n=1 Tax=Chitinophaga eiseniae TaxID=634771 RepID=A0A847SDS6_9BACT|nr:tryptophan 7-halogenase [Chitinophaga eiseniae]NLR78334.1 hypothetical protein [Chitinophaga eiseniae]
MDTFDILILGAGPAGTCAALRLLALGYRVAMTESAAFPRHQIGESLSPGIHNLFDYLDATALLQQPHCQHRLPAQVIWESTTPFQLTPQLRGHGMMVNRGLLDKDLLELAVARGLHLFQPVRYERCTRHTQHWEVQVRLPECRITLHSRFVLDARGRQGITQSEKLITAPPMVALWSHVDAGQMPAATCVEAIAQGWLWGAPTGDNQYRVMAFVDPDSLQQQPAAMVYEQLLRETKLFQAPTLPERLQSCPVTAYAHIQPWRNEWLQLGEAAFAIDPLSSTGVEKAMRFSLQAAIAVNTVLKGGDAVLAQQFYEEKLLESVVHHTQWTRQYYAKGWPGAMHAFWKDRSIPYLSEKITETPFSLQLLHALQQTAPPLPPPAEGNNQSPSLLKLWPGSIQLSPAIKYVTTSCVVDDCLQLKTAIRHPNLQRDIAFLDAVEIYPLLLMVPAMSSFGMLVTTWSKQVPFPLAAKMAVFLWDKEILCPQ